MIGEKRQLGLLGRRLNVRVQLPMKYPGVNKSIEYWSSPRPTGIRVRPQNASNGPAKNHERLEGDEKAQSEHGWTQL